MTDLPAALNTDVARELLASRIPARLAYLGSDGGPRVLPIWFHWTGEAVVIATSASSPKFRAIRKHPDLALTIDGDAPPYRSLQLRGRAEIEIVDGLAPEYETMAYRYYPKAAAEVWLARARAAVKQQARLTLRPTWARVLDVATLSPELAKALAAAP
jgi:PPOX class probable F420-dependent enzyme